MKPKRVLLAAVLGAACVPGIYAQEKANAKTGKAIKAVRFENSGMARGNSGRMPL
jgi:cytochrome c556